MIVVFEKIFDSYFFLSAMVDVEGVKTTLKIGGVKHILLNISEIIEYIVLCMLMKFAFFNDECNGVYRFAKKSFV